jgi:hypothetical protein
MDQDDPQKRIAELERQLAERRRIAGEGELCSRPAEPSTNLGSQGFSPMPPFPGQVNAGQQAGFGLPPAGWQYPVQTPQVGSWRAASTGWQTGRGRRSIGTMLVCGFFGLNFLAGGLFGLGRAGYEYHQYQVGTPTTATIVRCWSSRQSGACYGRWSVGGVSQTGEVSSGERHREGESLDVHINGGKAYTADSVGSPFYTVIGASFLGIGLGGALLRVAWRSRR